MLNKKLPGMKNNFITILLILVSVFQLNTCKTSDPDFPERQGKKIEVSTEDELHLAVLNAVPDATILIRDGVYNLKRPLLIENKSHITICGASNDSARVIIKGDGWADFYSKERRENDPSDLIIIRNSEDIFIADITFKEVSHYGIKLDTESKAAKSAISNINVFRCHFMNIATRAFKGTATKDRSHLTGGSVKSCIFENTLIPDTSWLYNGDYISAIDMMYLDSWTFSDNIFRNYKGANGGGRGAIFIWNQSRNIVVERNVFIGCDRSIAFGNPSEPTNYEPGTLHNYDGIIRNNFITGGYKEGKGIEIVWADNIRVYNNTIWSYDTNYPAIHYFQKINRLSLSNNLVRGNIYGEGNEVIPEANLSGLLEGYFTDPEKGDLHLTEHAKEAIGKGIKLQDLKDDIDRQKRKPNPDIGADQR